MALRNKQNKPTTLTNSSTPTEQAIIAMIKDEGSKSNVRSQTVKSYSNKKVLVVSERGARRWRPKAINLSENPKSENTKSAKL